MLIFELKLFHMLDGNLFVSTNQSSGRTGQMQILLESDGDSSKICLDGRYVVHVRYGRGVNFVHGV